MKLEIDIPQIPAPDTDDVRELVSRVMVAHAESAAQNECVSSIAVKVCNSGNPGSLSGIASAILTIGRIHGPITDARRVWLRGIGEWLKPIHHNRVPGFGNSFFPDGDPKWFPVRAWLKSSFPKEIGQLQAMEGDLLERHPTLHANAAMYTAITCELLCVPIGQEPLLFILPRLPVWFNL